MCYNLILDWHTKCECSFINPWWSFSRWEACGVWQKNASKHLINSRKSVTWSATPDATVKDWKKLDIDWGYHWFLAIIAKIETVNHLKIIQIFINTIKKWNFQAELIFMIWYSPFKTNPRVQACLIRKKTIKEKRFFRV